jgi:GT2 family glycosyltransferase
MATHSNVGCVPGCRREQFFPALHYTIWTFEHLTGGISVGIATRDNPEGLMRCLLALLDGDLLPREILVIDQSRGSATEQAIPHAPNNVNLVYVRQTADGLSASRNEAVSRYTGDVLAVTDDDCIPDAHWVKTMNAAFSTSEPPAAITGRVLPYGPEAPRTVPVSSRTSTIPAEFHGRSLTPWSVGTGANFAIRREWLARIAGYDERLGTGSAGMAGEDIDILYRLLCAGGSIRYSPELVVYHERQDLARRRASRPRYGHGIGACCSLWFRSGDRSSVLVLARWLWLRLKLLTQAILVGRWTGVVDECLVMRGTIAGLRYGATHSRNER